jgi:hypothetical protein
VEILVEFTGVPPDLASPTLMEAFKEDLKSFMSTSRNNLLRDFYNSFIPSSSKYPNCCFLPGDSEAAIEFNQQLSAKWLYEEAMLLLHRINNVRVPFI